MPLITAAVPDWKKRKTVSYRDAKGNFKNMLMTAAPSGGAVTVRYPFYLGTSARVLASIPVATALKGANSVGKYHIRRG
jgi:hypothetical protein